MAVERQAKESSSDLEINRIFEFENHDGQQLTIRIPEIMNPSYGMYTWPCAPVLAQFIWYNRHKFKEKHVLELSAGTSLPGIVAAKCGASVLLSDCIWLQRCLKNCLHSCEINGLTDVQVLGISWGLITSDIIALPPIDIILSSDCFYEPDDFEDILITVAYLLQRNRNGKFYCTYQVRWSDWNIEDLLLKWNLNCKIIPLDDFEANTSNVAKSGLPGQYTIEMLEIESSLPIKP